MRVLLINPNFDPPKIFKKNDLRNTPSVPVNVLSVATYLKTHGHDPVIIDRMVDHSMKNLLAEAKKADLVGLSVMTAQVKEAIKIIDAVKRETDVPVVLGGIHATLFPQSTCDDRSVDFAVFGEGEETLLELIEALEKKKSFKHINGLVYKENGRVIKNPDRSPMDIANLPPLDFSLIDAEIYIT